MVSLRFLVTGAAALMAAPVMAALSPSEVVTSLEQLTDKFQDLQPVAESITPVNAPLITLGEGPYPRIINGLGDIAVTIRDTVGNLKEVSPVGPGVDSDNISNAYQELASVQVALYNLLMKKIGLLPPSPFIGAPMAASLREVERVVDQLTELLIENVPSRATDIQLQAQSQKLSLDACIAAHDASVNPSPAV